MIPGAPEEASAKPKKLKLPPETGKPSSGSGGSTGAAKGPVDPNALAFDDSALRVEYGACPADTPLQELEPDALVALVHQRCRNLRVPAGAAPTDVADDDVIVALCVNGREATEPKDCGLAGHVEVDGEAGTAPSPPPPLVMDGDLAFAIKGARIDRVLSPMNGTRLSLVLSASAPAAGGAGGGGGSDTDRAAAGGKTTWRSPLVWRRGRQPYGRGAYVWFPLPMVTTDFSSSAAGYRLGLTPVAIAAGIKLYPSSSKSYVGTSIFAAWNLLVPNDVGTLTNTLQVRINAKAVGGGILVDGSGWVALGVGVGHTFTSDARTDFRTWVYFGPRLLGWLTDF